MKLEYEQQPSTDEDLKYIVYYNETELHVVVEADANKTLKQVLEEYLKIKEIELILRKSNVA